MFSTGLEFAPGTSNDCKRLVGKLFSPRDLLGAYRAAREQFGSSDIVIVTSEQDPSGFSARTRSEHLAEIRRTLGAHAERTMLRLGIAQQSAHALVRMPKEADAFWLVVTRGQQLPIEAVLFSIPYQVKSQELS